MYKLLEYIKKTPGKQQWCVYSEDGKNMGCYPTKSQAEERLAQIEMFKHMDEASGQGQGQGVGGPKQGDGGTDICECPACGVQAIHKKGVPCQEISCPECGTKMIGRVKENIMKKKFYRFLLNQFGVDVKEQINTDAGIEKVLKALLVERYGLEMSDADMLVNAGFDKEAVMSVMDNIDLAEKLKEDYLELINVWKTDIEVQAKTDLEFLMKESYVPFVLVEAENKDGTVWKVKVIEKGKSYNKTVYTDKALEDIVRIINEGQKEGAPVQCNAFKLEKILNHLPDKARKFTKGFVENIVGWFKNAKKVGKDLIAELHLDEGADKIRSLLLSAHKKGIKKPFGLSIDGHGEVEEGHDGKEPVLNVIGIDGLKSIDCVTFPSAGGAFLSLVESVFLEEKAMFKLLLEMIGRVYPELIEGVNLEEADLEIAKKVLAEAKEKDERMGFDLTEENIAEAIKKVSEVEVKIREEKKEAEGRKTAEPAEKGKSTGDRNKDPEDGKEVQEGSDAVAEARKVLEEAKKIQGETEKERCKMLLDRVLGESGLPRQFSDMIRDEFSGRVFEEKKLRGRIDSLEKAVKGFQEINGEEGDGPTVTVEETERSKKLDELQLNMDVLCGVKDEDGKLVEGRDRWRGSIKRAYIDITGDENVDGNLSTRRKSRLHESITTGDFPELLANSMTKKLVRQYEVEEPMYRNIASVTSVRDFKTQDRIAVGEFADLFDVVEDDAYQEFAVPSEEKSTYVAITKGGFVSIHRKAIINDDLNKFSKLVSMLGRSAMRTLNKYAFGAFLNVDGGVINAGTIYDGNPLYDEVNHSNTTTDALTFTSLDNALISMWNHKDIDGQLEYGIEPKYLWVPRELKSTAKRIIGTEKLPGGNDNDMNPVYEAVEVKVAPYLFGDANNWYLNADPNRWDGLELGFYAGREQPTLITAQNEAVDQMFSHDRLRYKVRHEYGIGTLDYRPFFAGIVA